MFIRTPYHNIPKLKRHTDAQHRMFKELITKNDTAIKTIINSQVSLEDDAHKRWNKMNTFQTHVWNYFCKTIAKQIVSNGLKSQISFTHLFKQLSIARAKCEWIKSLELQQYSDDILSTLLKKYIVSGFSKGFGNFQYSHSEEGDVLNEAGHWGYTVAKFTQQRIKNNETTGLSTIKVISSRTYVCHPFGSVLSKLENDFNKLCSATNFFSYLKIASRISFMISNYPPITRGSAAVISWLIDCVGQEKFGIPSSIRPALYDWTAFFETADQYTAFYVISSSLLYIQSLENISTVIPEIQALIDKISIVMQRRPDNIEAQEGRKKLWEELKNILVENMHYFETSSVYKIVSDLAAGNLTFNSISDTAKSIAEKYAVSGMNMMLSPEEKQYLDSLIEMHSRLANTYLSAFGNPDEEKRINSLWTDCGFLLENGISLHNKLIQHEEHIKNRKLHKYLENDIIQNGYIDCHSVETFSKLLNLIETSKTGLYYMRGDEQPLNQKIVIALKNGMQFDQLNECYLKYELTASHIEVLVSHAAILLYNINPNLSIEMLLNPSSKELTSSPSLEFIEMNILSLLAEHYFLPEKIMYISDPGVRECLLKHSAIPCFFQNIPISQLIAKTEYDTAKKILITYLEIEFSIKNPEVLINSFGDQKILRLLRCLTMHQQDKQGEDILLQAASMLVFHHYNIDVARDTVMREAFSDVDTYKAVIHMLLGRHNLPLDQKSQLLFDEYSQAYRHKSLIFGS